VEVVAGVEEVAEAEEAGVAVVAEAEAEDICIDLGGVITEDGIDDLYCGVTGMLGLACLLIGLYHVIASEVVQRMDVLFPEQD
jgi:predicted RNA methylase